MLLSDEDHAVAEQYGTCVQRKNYGRTYMGIERSTTFVIDADVDVSKVLRKVEPAEHADDVLAALPSLTLRARSARTCARPCRRGDSATCP